jgi:hypothetical protein
LKVAIGFFTHLFDSEVRARYLKLKSESTYADTYIVAELGTPVSEDLLAETIFFDYQELAAGIPRLLGDSLVPGNCHLPMLAFFQERPHYDHYWHIEYDVVFTGSWNTLFEAYRHDQADLLATHLRSEREEPEWYWWSTVELPPGNEDGSLLRAFLPIYRISHRALETLEAGVKKGAAGHFEGLIPTLLGQASFELCDLGQGLFYTSSSAPDGYLVLGTMRYRPSHFGPLLARNFLYHPVKIADQRFGVSSLGICLRYFLHRPWYATKDLARSMLAVVQSWIRLGFPKDREL